MTTKTKGFTLMELMLVVFVISLIAGFAIPSYTKAVLKNNERDIVTQLNIIHAANEIYKARTNEYLPGTNLNIANLNTNLSINLTTNNKTISYSQLSTTSYEAIATNTNSTTNFSILINQDFLDNQNPCCNSGSCPTLATCN